MGGRRASGQWGDGGRPEGAIKWGHVESQQVGPISTSFGARAVMYPKTRVWGAEFWGMSLNLPQNPF